MIRHLRRIISFLLILTIVSLLILSMKHSFGIYDDNEEAPFYNT